MNHTINELGVRVACVGEEGSIAWCREVYPKTIERANHFYNMGDYSDSSRMGIWSSYSDFQKEMKEGGIEPSHRMSINRASLFGQNGFC